MAEGQLYSILIDLPDDIAGELTDAGTPFSFPAIIGVLALFGIVVNNSMMIVAKINQNLSIGMNQLQATADASASRLEQIMLTSICTIVGLTPITIQDPLWRGLGGAIIARLLFSGVIMLFFIPVIYYMWYCRYDKVPSAHRTKTRLVK